MGYREVPVTPAEFRDASFASVPIAFKAPEDGTYYLYVSKSSKRPVRYTVSLMGELDDHGDSENDAPLVSLKRDDQGKLPRSPAVWLEIFKFRMDSTKAGTIWII